MFFADDDDIFISPEVFHTFRSIIDLNGFEMRSMPTHTEDGIPIRKLYVSNLPPKTTRTELFGLFAPYGFIKSCWLRMEDRGPNRAPVSTYAFVTFSNPADAHKALIAPIHEKTLRGRRLRISPADSWHQPVEDADGRIRWKPQGQHYDEKRSSPYYGYEQENAENIPESSQSSDNQQVNTDGQSETEQTYNILDILNRDCLNNILMYVPIKDIIRSERVSKGWQSMVQEYLEGVRVFKTSWWQQSAVPLTTAVLRRVLARLGNGLLRLHIDHHWSALNDRTAHTVGKFCPHLDEVKVVGMQTKNWNPLLYGCKHLRNLSFITCNKLTDSSLVHLVKYESSLESLTIANNNQVTGLFLTGSNPSKLSSLSFYNCYSLQGTVLCAAVDTLPNLTTLKLDVCPSTMWKIIPLILNKVPNLQELSLSEYTNMDIPIYPTEDEAFCQAISKLTKLKVLNLSRNIYINNAVLKQIAQNCTLLESLNISSCNTNIKNSIVGVTDEGVAVVCAGCTQLRRLDVSYLAGVGAALAAVPSRLEVLTARACPALTAEPLAHVINNCSLLQEVDVCGCSGVSGVVVGAAVEALAARPRPLLLRLAGTAAAYAADEQEGEFPTHKLLTVDTMDDLSNPHLRPELADALDDCSDGSYDDLYDHDDDYDDIFGPDEELFLDDDMDDFEHYEYHIQMI